MSHGEIVSFLWGVADLIRDTFKRGKYQDVILPLTVLRRLDCVLAGTKDRVLKRQAELKGRGLEDMDAQLRRKVRAGLDLIRSDPAAGKLLRDELAGLQSLRVGRVRIIYRAAPGRVIELVAVGPRRTIYEETLRRLRRPALAGLE